MTSRSETPDGFEPYSPKRIHVPKWYRLELAELGDDGFPTGRVFRTSVFEVIRAAGLDFLSGCVVKYALRAGKKPGQSAEKDRAKVAESAVQWALGGVRADGYRPEPPDPV